MTRKTRAIIDLDAIHQNYQLTTQFAPKSKNIAVIKADAYGHGNIKVAQSLESSVPAFAVAIFEEAVELRNAGITKPILILQGLNSKQELRYAIDNQLYVMVINKHQIELIKDLHNSLLAEPFPPSQQLHIWLKLDSGMHRLGFTADEITEQFRTLLDCDWVGNDMVITSHLACASNTSNDKTNQQSKVFNRVVDKLNQVMSLELMQQSSSKLATSLANSASLIAFPETRMSWNRPGIMLYGLSPFDDGKVGAEELKPAMTFESYVIDITKVKAGESVGYSNKWTASKDSLIATISVGYGDGYPRQAKNGTPLLIAGQNAKLAGTVSMDMITADISECDNIKIDDSVELWGKNVDANLVAKYSDSIGYDLITGIAKRVPKVYS